MGVYYYPDPPWVLFNIDLRPEPGFTCAPFMGHIPWEACIHAVYTP